MPSAVIDDFCSSQGPEPAFASHHREQPREAGLVVDAVERLVAWCVEAPQKLGVAERAARCPRGAAGSLKRGGVCPGDRVDRSRRQPRRKPDRAPMMQPGRRMLGGPQEAIPRERPGRNLHAAEIGPQLPDPVGRHVGDREVLRTSEQRAQQRHGHQRAR
jgi:hypothetical protein